jgi:hypothetical protein
MTIVWGKTWWRRRLTDAVGQYRMTIFVVEVSLSASARATGWLVVAIPVWAMACTRLCPLGAVVSGSVSCGLHPENASSLRP